MSVNVFAIKINVGQIFQLCLDHSRYFPRSVKGFEGPCWYLFWQS